MINQITYRKSSATKLEVFILKVVAVGMIIGLVYLELTVKFYC
jgi:hypothetical protein